MDQPSRASVFGVGRAVSWLMVGLMLASVVYAMSIAIINWSDIHV